MLDMADVKVTILSFVIVGLMALVFINLGKWAFNAWKVPGLTELFNNA